MSESLEALPRTNDTVSKQVYADEVVEKAEKMGYFVVDRPANAPQALTSGQYNIIKGAAAGGTMLFTAPFIGAYEEAKDKEGYWEVTKAAATGFAKGTQRGVFGGAGVAATGVVTGTNQLRIGFTDSPPEPGQGRTLKETWEHIISTPYTQLVANKEPASFQADVEQLIAEGAIPAVKRDHEGKEVPYTYQFFITDEPKDLVEGLGFAQYNAIKGFIAGGALAASAPILDSIKMYKETNDEGVQGGFEGAVQGLGAGAARGFVGGMMLLGAGLAYGATNTVKGLGSLNNITKGADLVVQAQSDYDRLYDGPIMSLVLQKGQGLEDFIVEEEARKAKEAEEKAAFEAAKAEWYRTHPGEIHESDKVPEPLITLNTFVSPLATLTTGVTTLASPLTDLTAKVASPLTDITAKVSSPLTGPLTAFNPFAAKEEGLDKAENAADEVASQ
jgi:hypothetical protein